MLCFIAQHSPALRLDVLDAARERGLIGTDQLGRTKVLVALRRLRAIGCIIFDDKHVQWTGRAATVRGISSPTRARLQRLAGGDAETFGRLRDAEICRLQAQADAALAALRPPGAPPIDPTAFEPWRPTKRLENTARMRALLETYRTSNAARAAIPCDLEP